MKRRNAKDIFMIFVLIMIFLVGVVSATEDVNTSISDDNFIQDESNDINNEDNSFKEVNPKNELKTSKLLKDAENTYISSEATDGDGSRENPFNVSVAFNNTNIVNRSTFTFLEGEYHLKKAVTINKGYAQDILIQAEGNVTINGLDNINIFDIKTNNTVTINNINFINAYSSNNGAAINNAGNLTISNSSFYNNKASSGGAIYNNKGNLTILNSVFNENTATGSGTSGYGGAILNSGNLTLVNSILTNCNASKGGILYNNKGILNITSNNIFENSYALWAGILYNYQGSVLINDNNSFINSSCKNYAGVINNDKGNITIKNKNLFSNNNGYSSGGVISSTLGNIKIEDNNLFANNTATYGGIINSTGNVTIRDANIFEYNNASYAGAVVYINRGNLLIDDKNNFTNNVANYYGGSIYLWNANATINDSIFNNNHAQEGGCIYINTNCTNLLLNNLEFFNNSASIGGVLNTKVLTTINQSQFNSNNATKGGSIYAQNYLLISSCNFNQDNAIEGGSIYATEESTTQIVRSNFTNVYSNNETLNLQGENTFILNSYSNNSILYDILNLTINNPREYYKIGESIELEITSQLTNPTYYDGDILDNDEYIIYLNNDEITKIDDAKYNLTINEKGNYSVHVLSKILGKSNTLENIIIKSDNVEEIVINDVTVTSNSGNLLVNQQNNLLINLTKNIPETVNLTFTINNNEYAYQLTQNGDILIDVDYIPVSPGEITVNISVDYLNGTFNDIYSTAMIAYYNGYMGKSFTGGENFTTRRSYSGYNTLVINSFEYYKSTNWNDFLFYYDAASNGIVDQNKIVEALYYQGYNWNKNSGFFICVDNEPIFDCIANYEDTKGFANYNYPSGVSVFNLTGLLTANKTNQIDIVSNESSNALYGGYLVIIYANNTLNTDILINEGADLLNPESSGFGANSTTTVAYSNYMDVSSGDATLYTITAAAEKEGASKIIFNDKQYNSLADNYNNVSKLSIVESNIDNLVEGDNVVSLQSLDDNLFTMGTILLISHPVKPVLNVDTADLIFGQNNTLQASIYYGENVATDINKGKVLFKINGKTLKDTEGRVIYAKIINGTATIENYDLSYLLKNEYTIQAIYSGSTECEKLTSQKQTITITQDEPTLSIESITASEGTTITLKATVNANAVTQGKIVFKINGKTLKDANGKVIYAKVTNNTVSVEYTLPESYKASEYNITAVFISSDYPRLEGGNVLTVLSRS